MSYAQRLINEILLNTQEDDEDYTEEYLTRLPERMLEQLYRRKKYEHKTWISIPHPRKAVTA